MIKAIETRYKGYRFRSRLEARWAVFFDAMGIKWEYEPEGFVLPNDKWYLPDFYLPEINGGCYLEVKGTAPTEEEIEDASLLSNATNLPVFIAFGNIGEPNFSKVGDYIRVEAGTLLNCSTMKHLYQPYSEAKKTNQPEQLCECIKHTVYVEKCTLHAFGQNGDKIDIHILYSDDTLSGVRYAATYNACTIADYETLQEIIMLPEPAYGLHMHPAVYFGGRKYRTKRLRQAYRKARSARFEHGETPC